MTHNHRPSSANSPPILHGSLFFPRCFGACCSAGAFLFYKLFLTWFAKKGMQIWCVLKKQFLLTVNHLLICCVSVQPQLPLSPIPLAMPFMYTDTHLWASLQHPDFPREACAESFASRFSAEKISYLKVKLKRSHTGLSSSLVCHGVGRPDDE